MRTNAHNELLADALFAAFFWRTVAATCLPIAGFCCTVCVLRRISNEWSTLWDGLDVMRRIFERTVASSRFLILCVHVSSPKQFISANGGCSDLCLCVTFSGVLVTCAGGWDGVHAHNSYRLCALDRIIELRSAFALVCFPLLLFDPMCSPLLSSALLSYPLLSSALFKTRADVSAD